MSPQYRLVERYSNVLVPVPEPGDEVCATCWGSTVGYQRCHQCHKHLAMAREQLADVVIPIAIAVKGEQLAHELWHYKNSKIERVRIKHTNGLATVFNEFLGRHENCVATAAGVDGFDLVTTVPSGSRSGVHPLATILNRMIGRTRSRFTDALTVARAVAGDRVFSPDRFTLAAPVTGRNVLLVDDTWTTGASAQSASAALKRAGAQRVAVVVIGRHINPQHVHSAPFLARARARPFDWSRCCLGRCLPDNGSLA
ncbi:phosphoribosyltransferase [Solihabitans fulvus]|uniref:Phosphoribosyltransferase n=1 Tax=Solihabitans fulvus TaxID=1892852 RepID=A0A5B2WL78_9PSEU|nr:phosphoribosyltransferase [Solihabitans fulvus]KAA2251432.1 phosphoribosyltransferase [Solihabitans fulvus]